MLLAVLDNGLFQIFCHLSMMVSHRNRIDEPRAETMNLVLQPTELETQVEILLDY